MLHRNSQEPRFLLFPPAVFMRTIYLVNFRFIMEKFNGKQTGIMNLRLGPITCFSIYHHYSVVLLFFKIFN